MVSRGDAELVHQDIPGADGQPALLGQPADAAGGFGSDLQIVVDHGHLAVEEKAPKRRIALQQVQHFVEHVHQADPEMFDGAYHSRSQWVWATTATRRVISASGYAAALIGVLLSPPRGCSIDSRADPSRLRPEAAGPALTRSGPARKGGIACGDRKS